VAGEFLLNFNIGRLALRVFLLKERPPQFGQQFFRFKNFSYAFSQAESAFFVPHRLTTRGRGSFLKKGK